MSLTFYPASEDIQRGSIEDRMDVLMEGAERYKAVILDASTAKPDTGEKKRMTPRDQTVAYNWEEIARMLREVRELPEVTREDKNYKSKMLARLAEIYEVLRAAKMSKLEAVRLALISEANQLRGGSTQVA